MIKPDFNNSILNVSSSLNKLLGNETNVNGIKLLDNIFKKDYKNVIYLCLDGLGIHPLEKNLGKSSFLRKHVKKRITSTFPSTTTNATTTLRSARYPSEHGMFGWSLWFESLNRAIDIYINKDSYTDEDVNEQIVEDYKTFDNFFDKNSSDYIVTSVFPPYISRPQNNIVYHGIDEMFGAIKEVCDNNKRNFIYAYCGEPDATMHEFGVSSDNTKQVITKLNDMIENLCSQIKDFCLIITPDHGHIDVNEYIEIYKDKALLDTLSTPPFLEARALAFNVRNEEQFLREMKKYKNNCKLYKTNDLIRKNYFGKNGNRFHMLGDYIAVMKDNDKIFLKNEVSPKFKGHHTALTKKEMILPLIIVQCK